MAQNVKIAGASYEDVPAVVLATTDGGTATFVDATTLAPRLYTATIPATGWTETDYGVERTVSFSGVTFSSGPVFLDLNIASDAESDEQLEAWGQIIRATPIPGTGNMRVLMSFEPEADIPVRIIHF
ncbi:MAG: hypothetical protein IJV41_11620 [Oscillospiraceae bacterium]|nr:hypothetical protein [Oscillospiraceae bacterium]